MAQRETAGKATSGQDVHGIMKAVNSFNHLVILIHALTLSPLLLVMTTMPFFAWARQRVDSATAANDAITEISSLN